MLLTAIAIGFGLWFLLFRRRTLVEGNTTGIPGSAVKSVKATVDGKPVHSYIAED